jgi:hypothetical protein
MPKKKIAPKQTSRKPRHPTRAMRDAGRWLLGSVSQGIANDAPCAVLVARPKEVSIGPEIQPPCHQCFDVQRASHGDKLWCAQHATRHIHGQLHMAGEAPASLGGRSIFIRT